MTYAFDCRFVLCLMLLGGIYLLAIFCIAIKFFWVIWCCMLMFDVNYFGFCWFGVLLIWSLSFEINLNTFLNCSWRIVFKIVMLFFKLIDFIIWFCCKDNCTFYMVLLFFVMWCMLKISDCGFGNKRILLKNNIQIILLIWNC